MKRDTKEMLELSVYAVLLFIPIATALAVTTVLSAFLLGYLADF